MLQSIGTSEACRPSLCQCFGLPLSCSLKPPDKRTLQGVIYRRHGLPFPESLTVPLEVPQSWHYLSGTLCLASWSIAHLPTWSIFTRNRGLVPLVFRNAHTSWRGSFPLIPNPHEITTNKPKVIPCGFFLVLIKYY